MTPRGPPRAPPATSSSTGPGHTAGPGAGAGAGAGAANAHHEGVLIDLSGTPALADITQWEFDVFSLTDKAALTGVMWRLLDALGVADALGVKPSALSGFVQDLAVGYRENPFHNLHHATCVTHFTYMLVNGWEARRFLSPQQVRVDTTALLHYCTALLHCCNVYICGVYLPL